MQICISNISSFVLPSLALPSAQRRWTPSYPVGRAGIAHSQTSPFQLPPACQAGLCPGCRLRPADPAVQLAMVLSQLAKEFALKLAGQRGQADPLACAQDGAERVRCAICSIWAVHQNFFTRSPVACCMHWHGALHASRGLLDVYCGPARSHLLCTRAHQPGWLEDRTKCQGTHT